MKLEFVIFAFLASAPVEIFGIECYTGLKVLAGTSVGTATIRCDNSAAYCYNMSANAAALIDITKAGCSMWRCMFAQNKCISTVFQKIPISLCCCSTDFCNVGENQNILQPQRSGGWNAEPEHSVTHFTKDEVERRFNSGELDDDQLDESSSRATRFPTSHPTSTPMVNNTQRQNDTGHLGDEIELLL